ncbi:MAG: hypothetical protein SFU27_00785, partial [Thermonemataceae bacterium]|nr:hypothetical protein [Thermonemataceae bacterium]
KTKQMTLTNGNKVLITPLFRKLSIDYSNLYYIRRLRIEITPQGQIAKANIVEIVTTKGTVGEQKYNIIANVFEEIETRADAKIMVYDIGYNPQLENNSWKGEATANRSSWVQRPTNGSDTPPICYYLTATADCNTVQYIADISVTCDAGDAVGTIYGVGNIVNTCGGGSVYVPPYDPNNPVPISGGGSGTGDTGQDEPLDPNFTPTHIEDPEGIYKEYKTYIKGGLEGTKAYINNFSNSDNPQVQAMVSFMRKKLDAFKQAEADVKLIEKSKYNYIFKSVPPEDGRPQGETYYDVANNKIVVAFPKNEGITAAVVLGLKAHEMRHVGQFESGKLSFLKTPNSEGKGTGGVLHDLQDEVEAYKLQYILTVDFHNNGKVDFLGNPATNFEVNNTTVLATNLYNLIPTTQITIKSNPEGTTLQNATNPTDIFVKP